MDTQAPPTTDFEVDIGPREIDFYLSNGYLVIERIAPDEEVDWLTRRYDELISAPRSGFLDTVFDVARPYGSKAPPRLGQLLFPEKREAGLTRTSMYRNARRIAQRLLDIPDADIQHWGHILYKTGDGDNVTPWHQDEAYWDVEYDYHAIGAWLPLTDVGLDDGCLWFIPGSHRGDVLPHRHLGGDPSVHVLELLGEIDLSNAVAVPMQAGAMSFHHPRTLHFSRENRSGRIRRAWANEFQSAPIARSQPADRPWVLEGRRALTTSFEASKRA